MGSVRVTVRLFALAKEKVGRAELVLELPASAVVADLRVALRDRFPELGALWFRALIAVNQEYADDQATIGPGSQIAVIPPVSGGAAGLGAVRPACLSPYEGLSRP
jgi:molybdopterin converting factor subunit 1